MIEKMKFFQLDKDKSENLRMKMNRNFTLFDSYKALYSREIEKFFEYAREKARTEEIQEKLKSERLDLGLFKLEVSEETFEDNNFLKACFYGYISCEYLGNRYFNDVALNNENGIKSLEIEYLQGVF